MKKMIKLPLFLAIICVVSTGLLAAVNAWTAPIIQRHIDEAKNASYMNMLSISTLEGKQFENEEANEALKSSGLTKITTLRNTSDNSIYGMVFDGSVAGYGGAQNPIIFQVGFVDIYYSGFNYFSHGETSTVGELKVLKKLHKYLTQVDQTENDNSPQKDDFILDTDLTDNVLASDDFAVETAFIEMTAGATVTKSKLIPALKSAAAYYLASI